ncbi:MAG: threonine--tRNA ligase [Patescibacteria group bacterium]|nr:threonine--tRNA ligase [Patescibacteria group bacterium]
MVNKNKKEADIETMRHSLAHIMAAAVVEMFPEAKLAIGPTIENGFYYDFDLPRTLIPEDLPLIEEKMRSIIKSDLPFEKSEVGIDEAIKAAKKAKQPYKEELLADLKAEKTKKVSFYKIGNFVDLCKGPHVASTEKVGAFKLTRISGAYWKGDEARPMLQRIYGAAFKTQKELDNYLRNLEEAERRDHRKLGRELDLFSTPEELGGGLPIWHPKGAILREVIECYWKEIHKRNGYDYVYTPHIGNINLWKKSGHWDFYRENLYSPMKIDAQEYLIKPMNCPFHIEIYKSQMRSYRDLPIRYCELGTVYRYERSGVLHGLTRVRGFTQDDAHIFCRQDQLENEILTILKLINQMMDTFGFKYKAYLSTKPEKAIGSDKSWKLATEALERSLKKYKLPYEVDPGEGVFYGPKIDIKLEDALSREWQGPTIQIDFNFPEKFDLFYIDQKGAKVQPVMIHRTLLGSMERFIGVLIEHFGGAFPLWLAPIQVHIITVGASAKKYAKEINENLIDIGIRSELKDENETVGKKIRDAELQKIPYMVVIGDKEVASKSLAIRSLKDKKITNIKLEAFIKSLQKEVGEKK